jgi:hypothetical protein
MDAEGKGLLAPGPDAGYLAAKERGLILCRPAWNSTPEGEAPICRMIEEDRGLLPGLLRCDTAVEYLRRFGDKQP